MLPLNLGRGYTEREAELAEIKFKAQLVEWRRLLTASEGEGAVGRMGMLRRAVEDIAEQDGKDVVVAELERMLARFR